MSIVVRCKSLTRVNFVRLLRTKYIFRKTLAGPSAHTESSYENNFNSYKQFYSDVTLLVCFFGIVNSSWFLFGNNRMVPDIGIMS